MYTHAHTEEHTLPLSIKLHHYCMLLLIIMLTFPPQCLTSQGNKDQKIIFSISCHSAILNGRQYLYIMRSTLQYHYGLNGAGCKSIIPSTRPIIVIMKKGSFLSSN